MFPEIKTSLRELYLNDPRPWLVGFSGGKDSTVVAGLIVEVINRLPPEQRLKKVSFLCTDTRVEIPAIVGMIESTLDRTGRYSKENGLNLSSVRKGTGTGKEGYTVGG